MPPSGININTQDIWLLTRHHEIPEESISGSDESSTTVSRSQTTISSDEDDNQGAGIGVIGEINPPVRHVAVQTRYALREDFEFCSFSEGTAGTTIYGDSLYGNLYVIPICYVELGI